MPPNIKPIKGTKITSLSLIFLKIWINIKEPKSANTEAMIAWVKKDAPAKNIKEISMPNLAQSIVPAVVGETNLFCVSCCMISPHILRLIPVSKIAISLGILVRVMISS